MADHRLAAAQTREPVAHRRAALHLCVGEVMHARSRPVANRFSYPVFYLQMRMDDRQGLAGAQSWLFGLERSRPLSFRARDHGARDGSDLMAWLRSRLAQAGLQMPGGEVWLQTFPRVFGYAFKPVSFWLLYAPDGTLRVLVAEVNNTFGERHQYVLANAHGGPLTPQTELACRKVFHVSPFCETRGRYTFRLTPALCTLQALHAAGARHAVHIDYDDDAGEDADGRHGQRDGDGVARAPLLATVMRAGAQPATGPGLLRALLLMPLLTVGIVWRIHWQALRLWLRRVPYVPKPRAPEHETSSGLDRDAPSPAPACSPPPTKG